MAEIHLTDGAGASAVVAPGHGGWLLRYVRQTRRHGPVDVLHRVPGWRAAYPDLQAGSHVMFPIAGYSRSGDRADHYRWEGVERPLPVHGLAHRLPWQVVEATPRAARLALGASDATRAAYPFEFRLELSYALDRGALRAHLVVENAGDRPMPFSTGFHPYVRLPLAPGGDRARCRIRLPACHEVVVGPRGLSAEAAAAPRDLAATAAAAPARHFAGFETLRADLADAAGGLRVHLEAALGPAVGPGFRCLTAWSPRADSPFYCIEPRTAVQDAFSHAAQGQLTILPPGGTFTARLVLELCEAEPGPEGGVAGRSPEGTGISA